MVTASLVNFILELFNIGRVFRVVKLFDLYIWVELVLLLEHFECLDILSFLSLTFLL
jgi:hypothetical protein